MFWLVGIASFILEGHQKISPLKIWLSRLRDFLNKSWLKFTYSLLLAQNTLKANEAKLWQIFFDKGLAYSLRL